MAEKTKGIEEQKRYLLQLQTLCAIMMQACHLFSACTIAHTADGLLSD
jgi:hypothetical protein